jgi:hypothetical protein
MNENILSFIKWAAGIVITLAIISIVILIFSTSKEAVSESIGKLNEFQTSISESELTGFDQEIVSGAEVVYLIKNVRDDQLGIQVTTGTGSVSWYGYSCTLGTPATLGSPSATTISSAIDETSSGYINKSGKFLGAVYRDANETIVAITFTQQ